MRPPQPALFTWVSRHGPREPWKSPAGMFYRPGVGLSTYRRLVAVADAWLVRRVEEFDLSQAVGVGGLTAAAGIAIRSASCQQPRVAALTGAAASSLVSRLSAVVIGLCAVARRRHHPSDLRSSCSSCSSCCQSSTLTRRARIVRRTSRTHAHANSARTWLRRLVAALL